VVLRGGAATGFVGVLAVGFAFAAGFALAAFLAGAFGAVFVAAINNP
jgi:predicted anti-sigma-YlaC factor YlaD